MPASINVAEVGASRSREGHAFERKESGAFEAGVGPRGAATARVDGQRVALTPRDGTFSLAMRTTGVGRRGDMREQTVEATAANGLEAALVRPSFEERVLAGPLGLEQTFHLAVRPPGQGPLIVEVAFEGLTPRGRADDGDVVDLVDGQGVPRAVYRDLAAIDAGGRSLLAHLALTPSSAELVVDDADAAYPIVIDPLVATLEAELPASQSNLWFPDLAISVSECTALVASNVESVTPLSGGFISGPTKGKAFAYTRNGATWSLQQELTVPGMVATPPDGISAALSDDTAIVTNVDQGAIYFYTRQGSTWGQPQRIDVPGGGSAVSVSGDTALVSGPATSIYGRHGSTWTKQQEFPWPFFAISISSDTAVASTPQAAHVIVRNGTSWTEQQELDRPGGGTLGYSVSVSGDTIVVGDRLDSDQHGRAFVFVRSGTTWTLEQQIAPSDGHGFGTSVAVDGDTLVVGADGAGGYDDCGDNVVCHRGAVHVFRRHGGTWTEQLAFSPPDVTKDNGFGSSVSLSGRNVIVGNSDSTPRGSRAYALRLSGFEGDACSDDRTCESNACVGRTCQGTGGAPAATCPDDGGGGVAAGGGCSCTAAATPGSAALDVGPLLLAVAATARRRLKLSRRLRRWSSGARTAPGSSPRPPRHRRESRSRT